MKDDDIVIAKEGAPYKITKNGWIGRVVDDELGDDEMDVETLDGSLSSVVEKKWFTVAKIQPGDKVKIRDISTSWFEVGCFHNNEQVYLKKGQLGGSDCDKHGSEFKFETGDIIEYKPKAVEKPKPADFSKLEKLIIKDEVKKEILSVLKQHENTNKLFQEWGLEETVEYGRGMTFLFYGIPGTGKTWAAHCIAKAMGRELLVISASQIQSSEPGAANRNIEEAFAEAMEKNKVLLLDECDSLITVRSDVGMVIGSEINTLLTSIEKFEGIAILSTNRIETLDEALERRIALIVEFPMPDFNGRKQIWNQLIPKKMPLNKDVDTEDLASYNLTGGHIKNALLHAARHALADGKDKVGKEHFDKAVERVMASKGLLGTESKWSHLKDGIQRVKGHAI